MQKRWFKLDNAAKIFPPTSSKKDSKVFRFSCVLKEQIDEHILQEVTNEALDMFPSFRSILRKGFFWHYLEMTNLNLKVKEENKFVCESIYRKNKKNLLLRVTYFHNRINLEIYHALTDGTGALNFLKTIVYLYLIKKYNLKDITIDYDASLNEKNADSFSKYYKSSHFNAKETIYKPYQIKGDKIDYMTKVIIGNMSVGDMINLAHKYNTTLTGLVTGIYVWSIRDNMKIQDKHKAVYVDIPVNLRKYFKSQTARNFFSVLKLSCKEDELENIINYIDNYLKVELTKDNLFKRMNKYATIEHNFLIRLIPLFVKDFVLKFASWIGNRYITTSVSNLGIIKMNAVEQYIESFIVFSSTSKVQMCLCSYNDNLTISFTSKFVNNDIIKNFFRKLTSLGIEIIISNNEGEL